MPRQHLRLTIHVEREVAPFQNVFTHEANDGFITMDMGLRCEQNRETGRRYEHE